MAYLFGVLISEILSGKGKKSDEDFETVYRKESFSKIILKEIQIDVFIKTYIYFKFILENRKVIFIYLPPLILKILK